MNINDNESKINKFLNELARLLEVSINDISLDMELNAFEKWDSLTQISMIAFAAGEGKPEANILKLESTSTAFDLAIALNIIN